MGSPEQIESIGTPEKKEYGRNVRIVLKIVRHGERTKDQKLTNYGREVTEKKAQESGIEEGDFDAVKAIGSNVNPDDFGMGRSLETASIYAHEIAGDSTKITRENNLLNYENILSERPYDHVAIYNSFLPEDFNDLPDEEKAEAAKIAQTATVNHLLSLKTPEAIAYKKEATGAFAELFDHYQRAAKLLKSDSNVLIPAGTHGGLMELPLEAALIQVSEDGSKKVGFESIEEVGGEMDPSESFNVIIETDESGALEPLKVTFDNPNRPQGEMYLDPQILTEARDFYKEVHKQKGEDEQVPAE